MPTVSPSQIRAARAMLDWSMMDLARAAELSISTVKRFETGSSQSVSDEAVGMMQDAVEARGVRFLADDGDGAGLRYKAR